MKKLTLLLLLFFVLKSGIAQLTVRDTVHSLSRQDYLTKSKHQKTGAFILLGAGIITGGIGSIFALTETVRIVNVINPDPNAPDPNEKRANAGLTLMLVGTVATLSSIPLFVASSKNKRKAATLSFGNQLVPQMKGTEITNSVIPSITLKIRI